MEDLVMEIMERVPWITSAMCVWGLRRGIPVWEGPEYFERNQKRVSP